MSQNELTSCEKDTYHQEVERADRHHDCQRKGRVDGRSDILRQRFGHSCHKKMLLEDSPAVLSLGLLCEDIWLLS